MPTCPIDIQDGLQGCGSTNVSEPDSEGNVDCFDCGLWFKPVLTITGSKAKAIADHLESIGVKVIHGAPDNSLLLRGLRRGPRVELEDDDLADEQADREYRERIRE